MSLLDAMLARKGLSRGDVAATSKVGKIFRTTGVRPTAELERVLYLPRRDWRTGLTGTPEEMAALLTQAFARPGGSMTLRPVQAAALTELADFGMCATIRVGGGKTLITFLAPLVCECERPLLLIPAKLRDKTEREWRKLSKDWNLPRLRVESYEMLGRPHAAEYLENLRPDMIIGDEVHKLKNYSAAVTKRVKRYMRAHPETKFCGLSGTITKRSIHDYAHILRWCLGPKRMPLPDDWQETVEWADALDVKRGGTRMAPGALERFCDESEKAQLALGMDEAVSAVRSAYRRRLVETPGVISTADDQVACSLTIERVHVDLSPIEPLFEAMRATWETPDGHPFEEAVDLWRHARELSCGFYQVWWNERGFKECLTKELQNKHTTGSIEQRIVSALMLTTGPDMPLVKVVGNLQRSKPDTETGRSGHGTDSRPLSSKNYSQSSTVNAISAASGGGILAEDAVAALLRLITTTSQDESAGSYARRATELSALWGTVLRGCPVLLRILKAAIDAARPPEAWLKARKAWSAFVRNALSGSRTYDSPKQIEEAVRRCEKCGHWKTSHPRPDCRGFRAEVPDNGEHEEWLRVRDTFKPNSVPVWVDDATVKHAAEWLRNNNGLAWVEHVAVGEKISELSGFPYYGRGGLARDGRNIEDETGPCVVSIAANAEGRNLQRYSRNLIVSAPVGGAVWEQMLGRTHRDGQEADEVTVEVMLSCKEQLDGFWRAMEDAEYIERTTGQSQKLLYADVTVTTLEEAVRHHGGSVWR